MSSAFAVTQATVASASEAVSANERFEILIVGAPVDADPDLRGIWSSALEDLGGVSFLTRPDRFSWPEPHGRCRRGAERHFGRGAGSPIQAGRHPADPVPSGELE